MVHENCTVPHGITRNATVQRSGRPSSPAVGVSGQCYRPVTQAVLADPELAVIRLTLYRISRYNEFQDFGQNRYNLKPPQNRL
jgi:hypothetical protein